MSRQLSAMAIFHAMTAIVEQPGYVYLQAYKEDFYKHDKTTILNELAKGARYLWVVHPNGTHLTRIGVHPRQNDWATATIESSLRATSLGAEIYLISTAGVRKLTEIEAMSEIRVWQYAVANNTVRDARGRLIGVFEVRKHSKSGDGNHYTNVVFQSACLPSLGKADLLALRDIGLSESTVVWQSLFVQTESLTINGHCVTELLAQMPEPAELATSEQ